MARAYCSDLHKCSCSFIDVAASSDWRGTCVHTHTNTHTKGKFGNGGGSYNKQDKKRKSPPAPGNDE